MTAARARPPADPRQIAMFDLGSALVRAEPANDAAAPKTRTRRADPSGFGLRGVLVERSRSLDERPQWVALIDNEGNLKRLILRLTASAARKLLADEDVRFRETVFVRSRRGQRHPPQHDLFGWIQGRAYVVGQVYSIVMILRALGDDPMSGQRRLNLTNEVDELLRRVFDTLVVEHGEEFAVMQLWGIVKKAPSYVHAPWLTELWTEYREELMEEVSGRESRSVYPDWDMG